MDSGLSRSTLAVRPSSQYLPRYVDIPYGLEGALHCGCEQTQRLLDVDEEIALQNIFSFFVFLGSFICSILSKHLHENVCDDDR